MRGCQEDTRRGIYEANRKARLFGMTLVWLPGWQIPLYGIRAIKTHTVFKLIEVFSGKNTVIETYNESKREMRRQINNQIRVK